MDRSLPDQDVKSFVNGVRKGQSLSTLYVMTIPAIGTRDVVSLQFHPPIWLRLGGV